MKKSEEEIIYHMELIENLLNGEIPEEKMDEVIHYLLSDEQWRRYLIVDVLMYMNFQKRKEWN